MFAGEIKKHPAFGASDERSPKGFYRVEYREIWPDLDPYLMTRTELDEEIKAGIAMYRKYFPKESSAGFGLFVVVCIVVVVAAVAMVAAGAASAAGGAGSAASSGAAASGASATSAASGAVAAGSTGTAATGYGAAAGSAAATGGATSSAAGFGAQAFGWAQKIAPYAKAAGAVMSASGNEEGDKLVQAADAVEGSDTATDAGMKLFNGEMKRRGMELKGEKAQKALRERVKREQGSYAAWLRREAQKKKQQNPQVETTGQKNMAKWLPIATPFVLWGLAKAGED